MATNVVFVTVTDFVYAKPTSASFDRPSPSMLSANPSSTMTYLSEPSVVHSMPMATSPCAQAIDPSIIHSSFPAVLAFVTTIVSLLFFSFIAWIIYLRVRGTCPSCDHLQDQIQKWERGELKCITPEMVRAKDASNNNHPTYPMELELAKKLTLLWGRVQALIQRKKKQDDVESGPKEVTADRFFTVAELQTTSTLEQEKHSSGPPKVNLEPPTPVGNFDLYTPPTPPSPSSVYSMATKNGIAEQVAKADEGTNSWVGETLKPTTYSGFNSQQLNGRESPSMDEDRARKFRSRTYGGLPLPTEFENVDLGDGWRSN